MAKRVTVWGNLIAGLLLLGSGCVSSEEPVAREQSVSLAITASAAAALAADVAAAAEGGDIQIQAVVTGTLTATNTNTGVSQAFSWSITVNPDTLAVTSNRTIVLAPGPYQFSLLLVDGVHQYAGTATATIGDGTNTIDLTIRPILGDTAVNVVVVERLNELRLAYSAAELGGIADPRIGVSVDDGAETIYQINRTTGLGAGYLNLPAGQHRLELRVYDGGLQIGRSVDAQELVTIGPGVDLAIDLIALAGETSFNLSQAGGAGRFTFTVPAEVVDEAGGLAQLEARVSLVGATNPLQERALTLTAGAPGSYIAETTFPTLQYGLVTMSLVFTDTGSSPVELLGSCTRQFELGLGAATQSCSLTLRRRAVLGGRLLATVGINVFDPGGVPVAGALIRSDGALLGLTGSGFGTPGYLKAFLTAGPHELTATAPGLSGSFTVMVNPLAIHNFVIPLVAPPTAPEPLSCQGVAPTCGPDGNASCCAAPIVPGGTYFRSFDASGYGDMTSPATVSSFRLDQYEVTVGRFRKFIDGGRSNYAQPPVAGTGAHPLISGSGWNPFWSQYLAGSAGGLKTAVKCENYYTWTDIPGANEARPMNCMTWFEAFAFCAWDGGRLPTEAEWNYAAAGGDEQRVYPWSTPAASMSIDPSHASYLLNNSCMGDGQPSCTVSDLVRVGSKPAGNGRWGHSELAGNVWEWTMDYALNYATPCTDCAHLVADAVKIIRGGAFNYNHALNHIRSAFRGAAGAHVRSSSFGLRCVRPL